MAFSPVQTARNAIGVPQAARNYLDTLANKYVVKPKAARGINGFVFDYEADATLQHQADITDHYAEDTSAINDHVAHKPLRVTLRGYVGELVMKKPAGLVGALDSITGRLETVDAYLGKYTPQMVDKVQAAITKAQNITTTVDQALARANNLIDLFDGAAPGQTAQQRAFAELEASYLSKQLFSLETPWALHENMVIEALALIQDETTKMWSDVTVTLKQLRFVDVLVTAAGKIGGRAALQRSGQVDKGKTKGTPVKTSVLKSILRPNQ